MESMGENQKFELSFSEKAVRINEITVILFVIPIILMFSYVSIKHGAGWIIFPLNLMLILTAIFGIYYVRRLVRESYFTITENRLICVYKGRTKIEYPIKEISKIEEVTLEQVKQKHAKYPLALNNKGYELFPPKGVLITFNRAWIKSIFPVYFNPRDIEGFILAIKQRMEGGLEKSTIK